MVTFLIVLFLIPVIIWFTLFVVMGGPVVLLGITLLWIANKLGLK